MVKKKICTKKMKLCTGKPSEVTKAVFGNITHKPILYSANENLGCPLCHALIESDMGFGILRNIRSSFTKELEKYNNCY